MIRPLHPDDAPALYELFRRPSTHTCDYFESGNDLAWYQSYAEASDSYRHRLVAVGDGRLQGLGILEQLPNTRMVHQGQIRLLMPEENLNSDVGDELLQALIDLADNWLNLKRLGAESLDDVPVVHSLLRRAGFEDEGLMRKAIGPGPEFKDVTALARLRGFGSSTEGHRAPFPLPARPTARPADSEVRIRAMGAEHIEDLYELFRTPENCRTTLQLPSQEISLTRQRILKPPAGMTRLVAEYGGQTVGMISLRQREQACRAHVGGIGMMVHPDFWGLGIGSRLMKDVLEVADQKLHLTRVQLEVHTDNVAGIRLYRKFGFQIEGTKRFDTYGAGGWADTHLMARLAD